MLISLDGKCSMTVSTGVPCPSLYSTKGAGFAVGGVGVGLAALSIYLFVRHGDAPARTAYVVPTEGGAMAGFATTF